MGLEQQLQGAEGINNQQREKLVALNATNAAQIDQISSIEAILKAFEMRLNAQDIMIQELKTRPTIMEEVDINVQIIEEIIEQPIVEEIVEIIEQPRSNTIV